MSKQGSTSDPAARIFSRALTGCLMQTAKISSSSCPSNGLRNGDLQKKPVFAGTGCVKQTADVSDPVMTSNGIFRDDSLKPMLAITVGGVNQAGSPGERAVYPANGVGHNDLRNKIILGSNHRITPVWNSEKVSEVYQNQGHQLEVYDKLVKGDSPDKNMYDAKQKENFAVVSLVNHSNVDTLEQYSTQDSSRHQPKQRMKSVISVINNHLSADGDCSSREPALKRSASDCLNDNSESEGSWTSNLSRRAAFMSERGSDTSLVLVRRQERFGPLQSTSNYTPSRSNPELMQSESKGLSQVHLSYSDSYRNTNRTIVLKSTKSESNTPVSRFSCRSDKRHHRRSTYPAHVKRSAADKTPFSPLTRSSESSPVRRIKRARTGAFIPSYDLKSINFKAPVRVIDSHCHLDFLFTREKYHDSYSNYRSEHSETYPDCYEGCITIFCEPQNFFRKNEWDSLLQESGVWASFGCHPHMAKDYCDEAEDALIEALKDPKVVALGEIGLDYSKRNNCDRELQKQVLRRQLRIGLDHRRPLIIHCREAHDDCLEILKELVPREHSIHLHCFTDTWQRATEWLAEFPNLYIGITNLVTFPTAEEVHEIAKNIPIDRLLLETDTPYFVPKSLSLRWSHPGLVFHAAAQIAAFRNDIQLEDLLRIVRNNTNKVYGI